MGNVLESPLFKARIAEWNAESLAAQHAADEARKSARISTARVNFGAQQRQYAAAKSSRLRADWNPTDSSADAELVQGLTSMRARSRALIRDTSFATRAQQLFQNNVIGNGIGLQACVKNTRGGMNKAVNDDIEAQFKRWSRGKHCHKGKRLSLALIERWAMGQVFSAGDCFIRVHPDDQGSGVPMALELIEAERLADEFTSPSIATTSGNEIRMGVEVDQFFAPVAYYIRDRHPNEYRFRAGAANTIRRVPADQIIHLALCDRWPQVRGEPWLHTIINRVNDSDGYIESELVRARAQAATAGAIETPESVDSFGEVQADGSAVMELEPATYKRLNPGEKLVTGPMNSPNPQLDPFMRFLIREMALGMGLSYESLSGDYAQSNYSSSRMGLLDSRDVYRFLQSWFISDFRQKIHEKFMDQAVISRALRTIPMAAYGDDPEYFQAVRYKPRGWTWVDPTVEVEAYKEAVKSGFTSVTDVIAATAGGQDIEDVLETRAEELKVMAELGLVFETSPEFYDKDEPVAGGAPAPPPAAKENADDGAQKDPGARRLQLAR